MSEREKIIEVMAAAMRLGYAQSGSRYWDAVPERIKGAYRKEATAALAALEAAGVRLVYPGEAPAQLIDGDERTTVRIFTPYAPPNPGAITGIRKAEAPCADCIDGWCQMNCGPVELDPDRLREDRDERRALSKDLADD